uniref:Tripartite motif containing 11 n=1 Tax=Podarcis muralis TaxID=64176 RepID=A0A670HQ70_PODMU
MQRPGDMFFLKKDHVVTEFLSHFQEGKLLVAENGENETYLGLSGEGAMAAAGGHIQCLRDEATCSICLDYFKDPVTIPECGHNFCRSCLIQCWGESEAEASCLQCRERVQRRSLIPNRQLANMVEIAKNLSLQEGKEEGGKGGVCEEHQEPLKLFCKVHEAPICLVCDRSKEHENHKVIPLKQALEEYKAEICTCLKILRREREEILAHQAALDKESKDLLKLTETQRLKTVEKFRELRQLLEEQEKRLLNHVEEVEKEIAGRRDEQLARLSRKLSSLERIIQEMEEKRQQPASELLQDVRRTLQRYEERESPEKPLAFPPELRNRILESCDLNHLVEDRMNLWEGNEKWLPGFHPGNSITSSELDMPGSYCMELSKPRIPSFLVLQPSFSVPQNGPMYIVTLDPVKKA